MAREVHGDDFTGALQCYRVRQATNLRTAAAGSYQITFSAN